MSILGRTNRVLPAADTANDLPAQAGPEVLRLHGEIGTLRAQLAAAENTAKVLRQQRDHARETSMAMEEDYAQVLVLLRDLRQLAAESDDPVLASISARIDGLLRVGLADEVLFWQEQRAALRPAVEAEATPIYDGLAVSPGPAGAGTMT